MNKIEGEEMERKEKENKMMEKLKIKEKDCKGIEGMVKEEGLMR